MYPKGYDTLRIMRKKPMRMCSVPKCVRIHRSNGFCGSHDEQAKRGITPVEEFTPFLEGPPLCQMRECDRPVYARKLCRTHYGICHSFNIPSEKLQKMYDNPCEICGCKASVIHVDHDHSCCEGNRSCGDCIRGGLCGSCNMALGGFKESTELLSRASDYLERGRIDLD